MEFFQVSALFIELPLQTLDLSGTVGQVLDEEFALFFERLYPFGEFFVDGSILVDVSLCLGETFFRLRFKLLNSVERFKERCFYAICLGFVPFHGILEFLVKFEYSVFEAEEDLFELFEKFFVLVIQFMRDSSLGFDVFLDSLDVLLDFLIEKTEFI